MGITSFLYFLLTVTVIALMTTSKESTKEYKKEQKPIVEFTNSLMYTIDSKTVNNIIESKKAFVYKNSNELYEASVVLKNDKEANTIGARHIIYYKGKYFLNDSVYFINSNGFTLKSDELIYDVKKRVVKNSSSFTISKQDSKFTGKNLYLDVKTNRLLATNVHLQINIKENDEI